MTPISARDVEEDVDLPILAMRLETAPGGPEVAQIEVVSGTELRLGAVVDCRFMDRGFRGVLSAVTTTSRGNLTATLEGPTMQLDRRHTVGVHNATPEELVTDVFSSIGYVVETHFPKGQRRRVYAHRGTTLDLVRLALRDAGAASFLASDGATVVVAQIASTREIDRRLELRSWDADRPFQSGPYALDLDIRRQLHVPPTFVVDDSGDATKAVRPFGGVLGEPASIACEVKGMAVHDPGHFQCLPATWAESVRRHRERSPAIDPSSFGVGYPRTPFSWSPTAIWSFDVVGAGAHAGETIVLVDHARWPETSERLFVTNAITTATRDGIHSSVTAVPIEGPDACAYPPATPRPNISPPLDLALVVDPAGDEGGSILVHHLWDPMQTPFPARLVVPLASQRAALTAPPQLGDIVVVAACGREAFVLGGIHRAATPHPSRFDPSSAVFRMPMGREGFSEMSLGPEGIELRVMGGPAKLVINADGVFVVKDGAFRDVWNGCNDGG